MITLESQLLFLFSFVSLPYPIESRMHDFFFSFPTSLKLSYHLRHPRFDDVCCFTFHRPVLIPQRTATPFRKELTHCAPVLLCLPVKDPADSTDPPHFLAKAATPSPILPSLLIKDEISREQPEMWGLILIISLLQHHKILELEAHAGSTAISLESQGNT